MPRLQPALIILSLFNLFATAGEEEICDRIEADATNASSKSASTAMRCKQLEYRKLTLAAFAKEILAASPDTGFFKLVPADSANALTIEIRELPTLDVLTTLQAVSCLNGHVLRVNPETKEVALLSIDDAWGKKSEIESALFRTSAKITGASVYEHKAGYALASLLAFPEEGVKTLCTPYASSQSKRMIAQNLLVLAPGPVDTTYSLVNQLMSNTIAERQAAIRFCFINTDPKKCGNWLEETLARRTPEQLETFRKDTGGALRECLKGDVRILEKHWHLLTLFRNVFKDDPELFKILNAQIDILDAVPGSYGHIQKLIEMFAASAAIPAGHGVKFNYPELENTEKPFAEFAAKLLQAVPETRAFKLVAADDLARVKVKTTLLPDLNPITILQALAVQHGYVVKADPKTKTIEFISMKSAWGGSNEQVRELVHKRTKDFDEKKSAQLSRELEYLFATLLAWDNDDDARLENFSCSPHLPVSILALKLLFLSSRTIKADYFWGMWGLNLIRADADAHAAALELAFFKMDQRDSAAAIKKIFEITTDTNGIAYLKRNLRAAIVNVFARRQVSGGPLVDALLQFFEDDEPIKKLLSEVKK